MYTGCLLSRVSNERIKTDRFLLVCYVTEAYLGSITCVQFRKKPLLLSQSRDSDLGTANGRNRSALPSTNNWEPRQDLTPANS